MPLNLLQLRQERNGHSTYRPDIDGLRAVAIVSVVLFHAFPTLLGGGFVGVDVFFVISGFLISGILFRGMERGDFSFAEFYARRVKRIFPALIIVLAVAYATGWLTLLPDEFMQLGKHMAAGAGFVQNIVLRQEIGYFDTGSELKPLMHLWSLAIEEQFYLAFPVFIWAVWRLRWNVLAILALLSLVSFGLNVSGVTQDAVSTFYLPQTRFWELMVGAMLAYFRQFPWTPWSGSVKNQWPILALVCEPSQYGKWNGMLKTALSISGLALILVSAIAIRQDISFPGWQALGPVGGAFLLILAGPEAWVNRVILANKPMLFIGVISYPLYLWHWPLLSFVRIVKSEDPAVEWRAGMVVLSFVLAWLTYRLIERPIRWGRKTRTKTAVLSILLVVVGGVGYDAYARHGLAFRIPEELRGIVVAGSSHTPYSTKRVCRQHGHQTLCTEEQRPLVFLWGDSHANALYAGLNSLQKIHTLGVAQSTGCGNPPYLALGGSADSGLCGTAENRRAANEITVDEISKIRPEIVILHARWAYGEHRTNETDAIKKLQQTISRVQAVSPRSKIVVIGPVPNWRITLAHQLVFYWRNTFPHALPPIYMRAGLIEEIGRWDDFMASEVPHLGATYLSAYRSLCNEEGCLTRVGSNSSDLTATDYGHLSPAGASYLAAQLIPSILNLLQEPPRAGDTH